MKVSIYRYFWPGPFRRSLHSSAGDRESASRPWIRKECAGKPKIPAAGRQL